MNKRVEVTFNDELIFEANDNLPLKVGDFTYFSVRDYTPKSESEFLKTPIGKTFGEGILENIKRKSNKYHIKAFEVSEVIFSISEDYMIDIINPKKEIVQCIKVVETTLDAKRRDSKIDEVLK
jgi:hypothetical protein